MDFGVLSYVGTRNLGDEIQSIAALQSLPAPARLVDRESLSCPPRHVARLRIILNGWFCHYPDRWPPHPALDPLLISMHISRRAETASGLDPRRLLTEGRSREFLMDYAPVGARDTNTMRLLQDSGISTYYSGCLSLTLDRPHVPRIHDMVVANDIPARAAERLTACTAKRVLYTSHLSDIPDMRARFARARGLLALYASASCVVTTRLHCALPCLAMGTPVLFLDTPYSEYRAAGLRNLLRHAPVEGFWSGRDYNVDEPPANPSNYLELRRGLLDRVDAWLAQSTG